MKKLFFFIAAAAIGMASCTNDEVFVSESVEAPIAFKAVSKKATRSAIETANPDPSLSIYVTAYQRSEDSTVYDKYFADREFTNKTGDGSNAWTSTGANWPQNGSLDLIAYACDTLSDKVMPKTSIVLDEDDKQIKQLILDFKNSDKQLNGLTDVMYSNLAVEKTRKTGLSFNFSHSLAWIMLNFVTTGNGDLAGNAYKIRKVHLDNVYLTGIDTLTADYTNPNVPALTSSWCVDGILKKSLPFPAYANVETPGILYQEAAGRENKGLLIIPEDQTSISFEYATRNGGTDENPTFTNWMPFTIKLTPDDASAPVPTWDAGKKYVYNITVTAQGISFTASVSSWTTSEDGGTTTLGKDVTIGN